MRIQFILIILVFVYSVIAAKNKDYSSKLIKNKGKDPLDLKSFDDKSSDIVVSYGYKKGKISYIPGKNKNLSDSEKTCEPRKHLQINVIQGNSKEILYLVNGGVAYYCAYENYYPSFSTNSGYDVPYVRVTSKLNQGDPVNGIIIYACIQHMNEDKNSPSTYIRVQCIND